MRIFTTGQMKTMERMSNEMGVTYGRLMENAGSAAAAFIRKTLEVQGRNVMVFCGGGNNGGDGFVVSRKLTENGANVITVLCGGVPKTAEAGDAYESDMKLGLSMFDYAADRADVLEYLKTADIVVDALFGTGFHGKLEPPCDEIAAEINRVIAAVVSLDIPSGVNAATGEADPGSVRPDFTVAFDCLKPGHLILPGREFCGKAVAVDIGLPHEVTDVVPQDCLCVDREIVFGSLKKRPLFSNKGTFGRLLCFCGSPKYPGAAAACAMSALRSGVGLVTLATGETVASALCGRLYEATYLPLPQNGDGTVAAGAEPELLASLEGAAACLAGCGLGLGEDIPALTGAIIRNTRCPLVLDADALNAIAPAPELLLEAKAPVIITPHMGEMARLTGRKIADIVADRVEIAREFAKKFGVVLVLKDATTLIAEPGGDVYFNETGNPGLAKGGSGDCLAGIIASFAAQGVAPVAAAVCGAYLHGAAADRCAAALSQYGMLPTDILPHLCAIFRENGR